MKPMKRYNTDLPQLNNSSKIASYNDVKKEVNRLILEAVEKRLIADVPVGIFLSGGIDSSAIVAAASKVKKNGNQYIFRCI